MSRCESRKSAPNDGELTGGTGIDGMLGPSSRLQPNDALSGPPESEAQSGLATANSMSAGTPPGLRPPPTVLPEDVRSHIWCLVRYEGQSIWRAGGRDASEITDSGDWDSRMGRDGRTWAVCRCDPLRDIVEGIMLPCASKTLSQEGMRRWLLIIRNTIYVCGCGTMYHHLWTEALCLAHRQRSALRKYLYLVYARLQRGLPSKRRAPLGG